MKWTVIVAVAVMTLGVVPLMGIPGAVVIELSNLVIDPLQGLLHLKPLVGDRAWPAAILMTVAWPPCLILARWIAFKKSAKLPRLGKWILGIAICAAWGLLLTLAMQLG